MNGQLLPLERQALHSWILKCRPRTVLEIGTWKGGGSTWQIATALEELGAGRLTTLEINKEFYEEARTIYAGNQYVECKLEDSDSALRALKIPPNFTFFDGPNNAEKTLWGFKRIERLIQAAEDRSKNLEDYWVSFHDWDPQVEKCREVRPYIKESPRQSNRPTWEIIDRLGAPEMKKDESVGIVLVKFVLL